MHVVGKNKEDQSRKEIAFNILRSFPCELGELKIREHLLCARQCVKCFFAKFPPELLLVLEECEICSKAGLKLTLESTIEIVLYSAKSLALFLKIPH